MKDSALVIQPYLPRYRVPFFDRLQADLRSHDIDLIVAAPPPRGSQALRGDAASPQSWHMPTTGRHVRIPKGPTFSYLGSRRLLASAKIIVAPASATCLDTWLAMAHRSRNSETRVVLWGHLANFVQRPNFIDQSLEAWMLRASDHTLAYTRSGKDYALKIGCSEDRVTVLNNTIDTEELLTHFTSVTDSDLAEFRATHRISSSHTFLVIGGLDAAKNVELLALTLDRLQFVDPEIQLLVCGSGALEHLLGPAKSRGQVIHFPYADPETKARLAHLSIALVNLGRIGLVAVDALAMNLPVITTTSFDAHAPEYEYLHPGRDVFAAGDDPDTIATFLADFQRRTSDLGAVPTLSEMSRAFCEGLLNATH